MEVVNIQESNKLDADANTEPPRNVEVEQTVLGLLLLNNNLYNRVNEILIPEHFSEPVHERIFEIIAKLIDRGQIATPLVLQNHFNQDEDLTDLGGGEYLVNLAKSVSQIHDISQLAKVIKDLATRRNLIDIGYDIISDANKEDIDYTAQEQLEAAEAKLFSLAESDTSSSAFEEAGIAIDKALESSAEAMKSKKHIVGVSTGFVDLDNMLGGLQNSDLLILAGRPSMGKTAFAVNMALNAAQSVKDSDEEEKGSVGVMSLEMSGEQIAMRLLSMGTGINSTRIRRGDIVDADLAKLAKRAQEIKSLDIHVDDTPALSISAVRTRARRLKRRHNLRVLVIDYLQLLRGTGKRASENRVQEISEITQGLKAIAKELNIPVIALSQLSRAVEQRPDKRPQLSDLRESGSIEQDADVVMFIYRQEYYLMREEPRVEDEEEHQKWLEKMEEARSITDIIIGKQRNGPVGGIKLRFDSNTTMFQNLLDAGITDIEE